MNKSCGNLGTDGWTNDMGTDKGPLSPQLPPLQRRRLSSFKDAKKYQQTNVKVLLPFFSQLYFQYEATYVIFQDKDK